MCSVWGSLLEISAFAPIQWGVDSCILVELKGETLKLNEHVFPETMQVDFLLVSTAEYEYVIIK